MGACRVWARPHRSWLWTAVLALALVGPALVWSWARLRNGAEPAGSMNSAYARGEWAQAAERARRRLKSFPDDQEGLRILARATARLGRDAAANALFARLGARALHAEALYL